MNLPATETAGYVSQATHRRVIRSRLNGNWSAGRGSSGIWGSQTRPVVVLGVCMGDMYKDIEVNLVDRKGFLYPVLIGRSFLKENIVVDATLTFTREPVCKGVGGGG